MKRKSKRWVAIAKRRKLSALVYEMLALLEKIIGTECAENAALTWPVDERLEPAPRKEKAK